MIRQICILWKVHEFKVTYNNNHRKRLTNIHTQHNFKWVAYTLQNVTAATNCFVSRVLKFTLFKGHEVVQLNTGGDEASSYHLDITETKCSTFTSERNQWEVYTIKLNH